MVSNAGVKTLLVILSAAVIAALGTYAAFTACHAFSLMSTQVMIDVDAFIGFVAGVSLLAAALALLLHHLLLRTDRKAIDDLTKRIAQLEAGPKAP